MYKLKIITSTVRDKRQGIHIAHWVKKQADTYGKYEVELVDLAELDLPLSKEPNHPVLKQYLYETTKNWSRIIEEADAFVFVLGEYNHSVPAPLVNALDTICSEWGNKPAGIVSYGGISGGTRSSTLLVATFAELRIVPIEEGVIFPFYSEHINKETGAFEPGQRSENSARKMLDELYLWTKCLAGLRAEKKQLSE